MLTRIDKLEEEKRKYLGLYEMDEIDRDLFAGRLNDLNRELDAELTRRSKLQLELRGDQAEPVIDDIDRDMFSERLSVLNKELDTELTRRSKLELELRDDQADPVPYEIVRSLMTNFDTLLHHSPFQQRKTLLHLIVKKITLDNSRRVGRVELTFNEETEKHFLNFYKTSP